MSPVKIIFSENDDETYMPKFRGQVILGNIKDEGTLLVTCNTNIHVLDSVTSATSKKLIGAVDCTFYFWSTKESCFHAIFLPRKQC